MSHGAQKCTVPPKFNSLLRLSFICIRHVNYASESNEPSAVLSEYDGRPSGLPVTDFHQPSALCILTSSLLFPKRKILPLYSITNFSLCQYRRAKKHHSGQQKISFLESKKSYEISKALFRAVKAPFYSHKVSLQRAKNFI